MSDPDRKPLLPLDYARPSGLGRAVQAILGALVTWILIFIPMFFAGASSFEGPLVPWAWPAVGLVVLACGTVAALNLRRRPALSAGIWIGIAIGLLHTGFCFTAMTS